MNNKWSTLATNLSFRNRQPKPTTIGAIDEYQRQSDYKLPESYRSFLLQFGPGELSRCFCIAAPGYTGLGVHKYDLNTLNESVRQGRKDYKEYCEDPDQFRRAIFFATDVSNADYFWDSTEHTDAQAGECKIYAIFSDWEIQPIANTFSDFVNNACLGPEGKRLYEDEPQLVFEPAPG